MPASSITESNQARPSSGPSSSFMEHRKRWPSRSTWDGSSNQSSGPAGLFPATDPWDDGPMDLLIQIGSVVVMGMAVLKLLGLY